MTDHKAEQAFPGEPEGGWETGPELHDSELVSVVLCAFTGQLLHAPVFNCTARELGGHGDTECAAVYVRADNIEPTVSEITVSVAGSDPTVQ